MSNIVINPFVDIVPPVVADKVESANDNEWSMGGGGANGLKADSQGMWFGSRTFATAPWKVTMAGVMILTGGFIPAGGAAADINANATTISGGKITTNTINASSMVIGSMRQVFTSTPTTPYAIGDLWSAGSSGDLKRCIVTRATGAYVAADWDLASKYTDDGTVNTLIGNLKDLAYQDLVSAALMDSTIISGGLIITSLLSADNIQAGTLTVNATVGISVVDGGDIEFITSANPGGSFSQLIFSKAAVADKGWEIFFNATGGGGYQEGDLTFLPMSSNASDTIRLGMSGQACNLAVHGSIVTSQVIIAASGRCRIPVGTDLYT